MGVKIYDDPISIKMWWFDIMSFVNFNKGYYSSKEKHVSVDFKKILISSEQNNTLFILHQFQ